MPKPYADHLFDGLPAIYRADDKSGFVYRLLSLFADELAGVEETVDGIRNRLSPDHAPKDFLPWLASWVALVLDETWPVEKRRALIKQAVELYKWRGTIRGIKTFVEIYTGLTPNIIEHFKIGWQIGVRSTLGVDTRIYEMAEDAHCFYVTVFSYDELTPGEKDKVITIVEQQKPSHTMVIHYGWVAKFWQIGVWSTVGINMKVGG